MGNIESMFLIQYIIEYDYNINNNKILDKITYIDNYNKLDNINQCHICNKNLSNRTIYRCNDLSFCSIEHRNLYYKLN